MRGKTLVPSIKLLEEASEPVILISEKHHKELDVCHVPKHEVKDLKTNTRPLFEGWEVVCRCETNNWNGSKIIKYYVHYNLWVHSTSGQLMLATSIAKPNIESISLCSKCLCRRTLADFAVGEQSPYIRMRGAPMRHINRYAPLERNLNPLFSALFASSISFLSTENSSATPFVPFHYRSVS